MEKIKFQLELDRIKADPDQYTSASEFGGAVRNVDIMAFSKGDVIHLPANAEEASDLIFDQKIGENKTQFILVEFERDGQSMGVNRFYPSSMTKRAFPCDSTGKLKPASETVTASGTAAMEYRKHGSVNDGMKALYGKKLVISEDKPVTVVGNRPGTTRNTHVYKIDILEEATA